MYEYLDRRYAMALYEVAEEKGKVLEFLEDLRTICSVIDDNKEFREVIKHPQIGTKKKKETFTNIFKGHIDDDLLSFLKILIDKNRIIFLREKLNQMEKIYLEKNNTIEATVKTAVPLLDNEKKILKQKLENQYNKKVILTAIVDKSVLGGVYVRVNNDVIDGTVKSKLDDLKDIMLKRE